MEKEFDSGNISGSIAWVSEGLNIEKSQCVNRTHPNARA
jgi:hypothetical protein